MRGKKTRATRYKKAQQTFLFLLLDSHTIQRPFHLKTVHAKNVINNKCLQFFDCKVWGPNMRISTWYTTSHPYSMKKGGGRLWRKKGRYEEGELCTNNCGVEGGSSHMCR